MNAYLLTIDIRKRIIVEKKYQLAKMKQIPQKKEIDTKKCEAYVIILHIPRFITIIQLILQ